MVKITHKKKVTIEHTKTIEDKSVKNPTSDTKIIINSKKRGKIPDYLKIS